MSGFKDAVKQVVHPSKELSSRLQLSQRQELVRINGNRLFVILLIFLAVMAIWSSFVYMTNNGVFGTLPVVVFVGVLGGMIGIQNRLRTLSDVDLLLLSKSMSDLLLAPLVGGFLAVLLYILFISGLLQGALFPAFQADTPGTINYSALSFDPNGPRETFREIEAGISSMFRIHGESYQDYGKLLFWCFLAGYSERFVTDIIGNFEQAGTAQSHDVAHGQQRIAQQGEQRVVRETDDRPEL